jgi:membrane protein YdbS with pleckstrin-like domain
MTETNPTEPFDPSTPHNLPVDDQVTYYEGSPRLRGELGVLFLWTLAGLLIAGIPFALWYYGHIQNLWIVVIALVIAFVVWLLPSLLVRRNHYRVTNYRIDYEHGILFKDMDTLELWHVEDVSLRQGPCDRIFNVGTITIVSGDATTPRLELKSVDNPRKLLETLKTRIIAVKRQRGVVKLDMG